MRSKSSAKLDQSLIALDSKLKYQLLLNDQVLLKDDLIVLDALFNDLSGLSFAKKQKKSWLDKMSSGEAYANYLSVKARDFGISGWEGALVLSNELGMTRRVHFFKTHESMRTNAPSLNHSQK